ncbi:DNA repair helicase [Weissella oryzae SG25]|uniref:DNA repair helicase n=1 Tax=Weissella oryzae (strain DSM 25784 / JCM 18191 / LMG 30913 / SG25) TaxID=1329250 RepID=A0A069CRT2_WEIOS|nr:AAA family ATPase [Weissella oryzae]GAK30495.1 DNA repair helicase [Weissella oryzae SG25]
MKIEKAIIEGFGQWTQREFDFTEGFNVIYGLNAAGKTTLHQFIVAMLYGFPQKRGNRVNTYQQSQQAIYGGHLIFIHEGQRYQLTRLGRTQSELSIHLLANQQELAAPEQLLAEVLGPIDRETFEAVFSFNQTDLLAVFSLKPDDFAKRLGQLAVPGSEKWAQKADDLEQAASNVLGATKLAKRPLNQLLKAISKQADLVQDLLDKQPLVADLLAEQTKINQQITQLKSLQNTERQNEHLLLEQQQIQPLLARLDEIERQLAQLPVALDQQLLNEYDGLMAQISLQEANASPDMTLASDTELSQARRFVEQLAINDREQKLLVERQLDLQAERQHILSQHGWSQQQKTDKQPIAAPNQKQTYLFLGLGIFAAIAAIFAFGLKQAALAGLFLVLALALLGLQWRKLQQQPDKPITTVTSESTDRQHLEHLDENIAKTNQQLQALMPEMAQLKEQLGHLVQGTKLTDYQQNLAELQARRASQNQHRTVLGQLKGQQLTLLAQLGAKDSTDLTVKRQADQQRQVLLQEQQALNTQLGSVDPKTLQIGNKYPELNATELAAQLAEQQQQLATIAVRLERLANDNQVQQAKQHLADLRAQASHELTAVLVDRLAAQWINQTLTLTIADRLPTMLEKSQEYLAYLTANRYQKLVTSGKLLQVQNQAGQLLSVTELSKGTAEQLYVAMRLAFSQVIATSFTLPLLIDDAFVDFDDERYGRMINLLSKLGQTQQILYFTIKKPNYVANIINLME